MAEVLVRALFPQATNSLAAKVLPPNRSLLQLPRKWAF